MSGRTPNYEATGLLTPGATGTLDGQAFTLAGRRCIRGRRGSVWNEWVLGGVPHVILAESAGRFTLYREGALVTTEDLAVGRPLPWVVVERGTATCVAHWGDVHPGSDPHSAMVSWAYADLSAVGSSGRRATVSGGTTFLGTEVDPVALGLTIRREPPALVPAPNVSMPAGIELWLEVGDEGMLEGVKFHVLGIVARSTPVMTDDAPDPGERWEEYLIYAAGVGLRWLVVVGGHWTYVTPVEAGSVNRPDIWESSLRGDVQTQFARVDWATGELPWEVTIGETVTTFEVLPFVGELTHDDLTWSRQQEIAPDVIARAFAKRALPRPK